MLALLLRIGESEIGAWTVASGSMAQGAGNNAQVPSKRLHTVALEDCSPEKRLCSAEQATIRLVNVWSLNILLTTRGSEYAAAFFLLGGSLKDAVNVCLKQLSDFQLAVALARVIEGNDGEVLRSILNNTVLPTAFREGNRWLGSWAFWLLRCRDLSVRILLVSHQARFVQSCYLPHRLPCEISPIL